MPTPMTRQRPRPIAELLKTKTLEALLRDRDLFTPEDAAPAMGYTAMHVRYLCRTGQIEHVERHGQYYLYARTVREVFKHVPRTAKQKRG